MRYDAPLFARLTAGAALICAANLGSPLVADEKPELTPPMVPAAIQVPAGNSAYLLGHATGTQGYICLPTSTGSYAWSNTGSTSGPANIARPEAILYTGRDFEIITHFLSPNPLEPAPNPFENGQPRPTWQSVLDGSMVWGNKIGSITAGSDPSCPNTGSISCLLLQAVGTQTGPHGGSIMAVDTYIQRLNTSGGSAPASPQTGCAECCAASTDVGNEVLVPYTADYWFYRASE